MSYQDEVLLLEPRGRFPTDESPYGVRDMAGGAAEHCLVRDAGHGELETQTSGGSWAHAHPLFFGGSLFNAPMQSVPTVGLRLVAELK